MLVRISRIDSIEFDSHSTIDRKGVVAHGQVNTGGWSQIQLRPVAAPSPDGRFHLELVGLKPTGIVTQGFVKVTARAEINPTGFSGVVVHAAGGSLAKNF